MQCLYILPDHSVKHMSYHLWKMHDIHSEEVVMTNGREFRQRAVSHILKKFEINQVGGQSITLVKKIE